MNPKHGDVTRMEDMNQWRIYLQVEKELKCFLFYEYEDKYKTEQSVKMLPGEEVIFNIYELVKGMNEL